MARSFHETRRRLEEERRWVYADEEAAAKQQDEKVRQLDQKRWVKTAVREARRRPMGPEHAEAEGVSIRVCEPGPLFLHPAETVDVRAVLRAVPGDALSGLRRIELTGDPDGFGAPLPIEGQVSEAWNELMTGVFVPNTLGRYKPEACVIALHPYRHTGQHDLLPLIRPYLRLRGLSVLVHELAHHQHHMNDDRRGRWMIAPGEAAELYAEVIQQQWLESYVLPYLRSRYANEIAALERWIAHHGGAPVSFERLAGDARKTARGGFVKLWFGEDHAFECLVSDVAAGKPLSTTRVEFARNLHYADLYDDALLALELVLAANPHAGALALKADIHVHQERYDEAEREAQAALRAQPGMAEALDVLTDVYLEQQNWSAAAETAGAAAEAYGATWEGNTALACLVVQSPLGGTTPPSYLF